MACEHIKLPNGGTAIICGVRAKKLPFCRFCEVNRRGKVRSTKLCDADIGHGKTCDAPICEAHAKPDGPGRDLCPIHWGTR